MVARVAIASQAGLSFRCLHNLLEHPPPVFVVLEPVERRARGREQHHVPALRQRRARLHRLLHRRRPRASAQRPRTPARPCPQIHRWPRSRARASSPARAAGRSRSPCPVRPAGPRSALSKLCSAYQTESTLVAFESFTYVTPSQLAHELQPVFHALEVLQRRAERGRRDPHDLCGQRRCHRIVAGYAPRDADVCTRAGCRDRVPSHHGHQLSVHRPTRRPPAGDAR